MAFGKRSMLISRLGANCVFGIVGGSMLLAMLVMTVSYSSQTKLLEEKIQLVRKLASVASAPSNGGNTRRHRRPETEDLEETGDKPDIRGKPLRHRRAVDEMPETDEEPKDDSHGNQAQTDKGGAVYIRWGRTQCPGEDRDVETLYSGVAGGSWYAHSGAASEMLCLPNDPVWGRYSDGAQGYAFMYGAEYEETADFFLKTNAETFQNHNIPCVVCRSRVRSTALMIAARNVCYHGWHVEYHGYLLGGHYTHGGSQDYVCVDEAPEADPAGYLNENGRLLYRVEAACGSLPCPEYVNQRELTCVVCSA